MSWVPREVSYPMPTIQINVAIYGDNIRKIDSTSGNVTTILQPLFTYLPDVFLIRVKRVQNEMLAYILHSKPVGKVKALGIL